MENNHKPTELDFEEPVESNIEDQSTLELEPISQPGAQPLAQSQPSALTEKTPMDMIYLAVSQGADIEKIRALMELKREWEADEAKKAFHYAMAQFKKNTPEIFKDKHVNYETSKGKVDYWHTSLDQLANKCSVAMAPFGLSFTWDLEPLEGGNMIKVSCIVSHEAGYSKATWLPGAPDQSGGKNNIQAVGSTVKYLERYTLEAALGIASKDPLDDDGRTGGGSVNPADPGEQPITDEQHNTLHALITDNDIKMTTVEKWLQSQLGCDSLKDVKQKAFGTVKSQIEATIKARKAKQQSQ